MTQVSKTGPWFSPRPVGSGFGEPTHLEEKPKADKAQERPDGYQPKAGEGGGRSKDGPVPTHHVDS